MNWFSEDIENLLNKRPVIGKVWKPVPGFLKRAYRIILYSFATFLLFAGIFFPIVTFPGFFLELKPFLELTDWQIPLAENAARLFTLLFIAGLFFVPKNFRDIWIIAYLFADICMYRYVLQHDYVLRKLPDIRKVRDYEICLDTMECKDYITAYFEKEKQRRGV